MRRRVIGILTLAVLFSAGLYSQAKNEIAVSGTVTDTSGAVVAGAEITVKVIKCKCSDCKNPDACTCCPNQFTRHSGEEGKFEFSVPHGTYSVEVRVSGHKPEVVTLDLNEGGTKNSNITVR